MADLFLIKSETLKATADKLRERLNLEHFSIDSEVVANERAIRWLEPDSVLVYYREMIDDPEGNYEGEGPNAPFEDSVVAYTYLENNEGIIVPVLYKTSNSDPDTEEPFFYEGVGVIDGEFYDKWRKIEIHSGYDGFNWNTEARQYIYTNRIVTFNSNVDGIIPYSFPSKIDEVYEIGYDVGYALGKEAGPRAYHLTSADELPTNAADGSLAVVATMKKGFVEKTWNGMTFSNGECIWTDGENVYYSEGETQYVLYGDTWETKEWKGLTTFYGYRTWTNGENTYYSDGIGYSYILNGDTWEEITFEYSQYTVLDGNNIFTHNGNAYFTTEVYNPSTGSTTYHLFKLSNNVWSLLWTLDNLWSTYGVWSDGKNLYYCDNGTWDPVTSSVVYGIYRLGYGTKEKVSSASMSVNRDSFWADGNTLYYAYNTYIGGQGMIFKNYIFTDGVFEEVEPWNISVFYATNIWTDGVNTYYTSGIGNYVLGEYVMYVFYVKENGEWISKFTM